MEQMTGIVAFVRAAELRSFTRAAKVLGMTSSGVGKAIGRLEAELGVRLLHRTTRRIGLTDDGAVFFEECRRILDDLESARALMSHRSATPRGRLRVSLPTTIGKRIVLPALPRFLEAHADVWLDIGLSDLRVNLVEDGVDVALRVGALADSSLVARPIGQQQILTIASPAAIARAPVHTLGDLTQHRCLSFRMPTTRRERAWTFRIDGRPALWAPRAFLTLDDGEALVEAVKAGIGVAQVPSYMAHEALATGAVVEVLAELRSRPDPISAVYVSQRNLPARTRAFVDFLSGLPGLGPTPLPGPARRRAKA
jgi:DNA-binding transcriptional LysR family regulator